MYVLKTLAFFVAICSMMACSSDDSSMMDTSGPGGQDISANLKGVGASSNDLLAATTFTSLQVEVVYVEGNKPTNATLQNVRNFLGETLNKPQGITVNASAIASPGLAPYSIGDLQQVETNFRIKYNKNGSIAVFVFITDGEFADNSNVLGVAYRNTSAALFGSRINELSGGTLQPSQTLLESTVLHHELAHLMGLVNVGTPLQTNHQDTAHGKHCDVESCLMYFTAETGDAVDNLLGTNAVPELDSQCIADLKANGGK